MSDGEGRVPSAREITIAVLTSARESTEFGRQYSTSVFGEMPDSGAALLTAGEVIGQLVAIVNSLRGVPQWGSFLDQYIVALAHARD